jgi:mRNA-degrading endonuclease YafQ of YafQ-DinJ toxin-antitoxin module
VIKIDYKPSFIRQLKKLDSGLRDEVLEKIKLLKDVNNHDKLKVHKLHGRLENSFGFSVNYKIRIVFDYVSKDELVLLVIGDHDVYK